MVNFPMSVFQYEDTLDDYLEMFIQFGYVTLFSSAFPLAAFCALLNNVVEIRSDAFKLCMTYQRPFGKTVENIGTWQVWLLYMLQDNPFQELRVTSLYSSLAMALPGKLLLDVDQMVVLWFPGKVPIFTSNLQSNWISYILIIDKLFMICIRMI